MQIIKIAARDNGSRPPIQSWYGVRPPTGYARVPDSLDLSTWAEYRGFVVLELDGDTVAGMRGNADALAAYLAALPEPTDEPLTDAERIAALEAENTLLKAQISAQSDQMDFYEDCIAEMATVVYA